MNTTSTVKGLLGAKLGMTQVWDADNKLVPVTVVQAGPCVVSQVRTSDTDGYNAVQIAYGAIDPRKVNQPMAGHFAKAGVTPRRFLVELRTADAGEHSLGQELTVDLFEAGQSVDVVGRTKGKGTAGVMKRHGFHGVSSSHGSHRNHRKPGSIGACATPGPRVQGHEDGRAHGLRAPDRPEPHRPRRGRRARPHPDQGCSARPQGSVVLVKTAAKGA